MIWANGRRQYTWLAIGARTFALLTLAGPIAIQHRPLLLLALLSVGSIWAAVTAGELLDVPATLLLILDSALIGSVAGLSSHSATATIGAMAVPPFTAGLRRGTRGVALSLSSELTAYVVVALVVGGQLSTGEGLAAFTWAITGLGLGLIAAFVNNNFLDVTDPQRAYRDAQMLIHELIGLSGKLSSGLDPVALGGQIVSAVRDELPVSALTVPVPRGDVLTPLVGDIAVMSPELAVCETLALQCRATGGVQVSGHCFAFALTSGGTTIAVVAGVLASGLDPSALDMHRKLTQLDRHLSPAAVRLDAALSFLAFRDSATVEERRRLAREMHDGVAQEIASLGYFVDSLVDQEELDSGRAQDLRLLRERLTLVVGEVRRSVQTLRTSIGENESLGTAIGGLARHLGASSGIPIHVTLDEGTTRLRPEVESELLRIAQEAMTNAVRHSGASRIDVQCRVSPPNAELVVSDDGAGLGPSRDDSHGLEIMQERAVLIDAAFEVSDRSPRGTTILVHLPAGGVSIPPKAAQPDTLLA